MKKIFRVFAFKLQMECGHPVRRRTERSDERQSCQRNKLRGNVRVSVHRFAPFGSGQDVRAPFLLAQKSSQLQILSVS